jgi:hypothetical protein
MLIFHQNQVELAFGRVGEAEFRGLLYRIHIAQRNLLLADFQRPLGFAV